MADVLTKLKRLGTKKKNDTSIYSMVSCSDLTPGSLEVWLDLPDEIKYDPALAPFKHLYEQHHGKLDESEVRDDRKTDSTKKTGTELAAIDGNNHDHHNGVVIESATKLMEALPNDPETSQTSVKGIKSVRRKQLARAARLVKLTALVAGWLFLTTALLMNNEQAETVMHTAIHAGEVKEYRLESTEDRVKLLVTLAGPFGGDVGNGTHDAGLSVWLRRSVVQDGGRLFEQHSQPWKIQLQPDYMLDFAPSVEETRSLRLPKINNGSVTMLERIEDENYTINEAVVSLCMSISGNSTVPLTLNYQLDPLEESDGLIYASILLIILYGLIIFEVVNRTLAALLCSSLSIAVLSFAGARPSLPALMSWLDVETLLLLFSMMLLVAIMSETGLFDYLAVLAFELTGGRMWPLIICLCAFTAIFSTFLDNVTTILLMTPVTIRLCEVMQLNPIAILMATVIFSNIGGTATPVGDPPNVIIASHPAVLKANINFMNFTVHMGTGVLLVCIQTYLQLRFMFRDVNKLRHSVPRDIQEMRQEIFVWKRAAASLSSYSQDEDIVRKALEKKVERLNAALAKKEAGGGNRKKDPKFCSTLAQMKQKYGIRDKQLLVKCSVSIMFVIIVFFLHAFPELQRLSLGWTALLGAILLLLLAERDDLEPILARVEWSTLLFFAALFVLMEALSKLGLIKWIGKQTEAVILNVNEDSRLLVALMLVLWMSGLASAFVDNIPLTTMMIRVTASLADPEGLNLPLPPLIWALSFGACLGGNGTLIGASANVVCAGVAEQHGYRFTFMQYFKVGFPIMIGNLIVVSVYLLLCHCVGHWH